MSASASSNSPKGEPWKKSSKRLGIIQHTGDDVEIQLRHLTQIKMIRVSEYFKDYDPLLSGFITSKEIKDLVPLKRNLLQIKLLFFFFFTLINSTVTLS